ncbi:hypothetical protein LTR62_003727 [Meristemomyces frigidus]|uniref:RING-type domain-containing protein n=1 Tax=Meristemomyces frigidus TaxID=1508187 RepID=A0AAN7TNI1_9PEZI|nr:hypothetical protein LTR62_003727 [Meristemomyces frigidus]
MDSLPRGNARKRLKISRSAAVPSPSPPSPPEANMPWHKTPAESSESSSTAQDQKRSHDGPCHHKTALKSLHSDIDAMRTLITCQICQKFMYEPYSIACGHTYCYSCLSQWLGNNAKKTCPDCRTVIRQQPTPSYALRELVLVFASGSQLLPDGETTEEHGSLVKEEADLVAKHKADADPRTGGLFKGAFSRGHARWIPLHDPLDGVERCPRCHWEIEDGECGQCGLEMGDGGSDWSADDLDSDPELDHDFGDYDVDAEDLARMRQGQNYAREPGSDEEDGWRGMDDMDPALIEAVFGDGSMPRERQPGHGHHRHYHAGPIPIPIHSDVDDSDDDDEEHDSEMEGFIDDEAEEESSDEGEGSDVGPVIDLTVQPRRRRVHERPVVVSDDEGDAGPQVIDDDDSEDEAPVIRNHGRIKRGGVAARARPVAISSDEDSDHDENPRLEALGYAPGGFSPPNVHSDEDEGAQSTNDDNEEDEDDDDDESDGLSAQQEPYGSWPDSEDFDDSEGHDVNENGYEPGPHDLASQQGGYRLTGLTGTRPRINDSSDPHSAFIGTPRYPTPQTSQARNNYRLQTNSIRRSRFAPKPISRYLHPAPPPSPVRAEASYTSRGGMFSSGVNHHTRGPQVPNRRSQQHPDGEHYGHEVYLPAVQDQPNNRNHIRAPELARPPPRVKAAHPFQLDNTLASINSRQRNSANHERDFSNASENSSVGGVRVSMSGGNGVPSSSGRTLGRPGSPEEGRRGKRAVRGSGGYGEAQQR